MSAFSKLVSAIYWLALTLWVSVLISAGVSATSAFTTLPDPALGLHLEQFAAFDSEQHGRIAAGRVMEPIFFFVDLVQVVAGMFAIAALIVQLTVFRMPIKRPANAIRSVCIVLAMGLFLFRAITMTPGMNQDLRTYWQAAEAGDVAAATEAQRSFDAAHQRARPLFDATLVLLLIGVCASAASTLPRTGRTELEPLELIKRQ